MGIGWDDVIGYGGSALAGGPIGVAAYQDYKSTKAAGDEKRNAYNAAADQYKQYGQDYWNKSQQGLDRQMNAYGQAQNVYNSQKGYFNSPGYLEQLYKQRQTGTDPYYNYMTSQLNNQNFNQMSARGLNNSTYAQQTGNLAQQGLIAQQSQQMAGLAAGASGEQRNRMSDQFAGQMGISHGEAGAISSMYQTGLEGLSDGQKNAIAAKLTAAGVSQEVINKLTGDAVGAAKLGAAALGGGGGAAALSGGGSSGGYGYTGGGGDDLMIPDWAK